MELQLLYYQIALVVAVVALIVVSVCALLLWRKNQRLLHSIHSSSPGIDPASPESHLTSPETAATSPEANPSSPENQTSHSDAYASPSEPRPSEEKYSHSNLTDSQRETLVTRIQEIIDTPGIICQQDFTLSRLAKMADSNTTYVSQVINEKYGVAFSNLLGRLRVQEACRRINDMKNYGNLTIEAIAGSVGFKSRSAFINSFKRETGQTPSEYQRKTGG